MPMPISKQQRSQDSQIAQGSDAIGVSWPNLPPPPREGPTATGGFGWFGPKRLPLRSVLKNDNFQKYGVVN